MSVGYPSVRLLDEPFDVVGIEPRRRGSQLPVVLTHTLHLFVKFHQGIGQIIRQAFALNRHEGDSEMPWWLWSSG